ncbi:MAG: Rubredoxin [Methanomassiliicoccales archaeon PtaU1.Bin124]|nr:MAG: Rubredoxin [Methanomassiliicoccales archaeon PtaU1.Bin124]
MRYTCSQCHFFVYDEERGDATRGIKPGTPPEHFPDSWRCPVCGKGRDALKTMEQMIAPAKEQPPAKMSINDFRNIARRKLIGVCGEFSVCDGEPGRICVGQKFGEPPGFGGAGQGTTFHRNYTSLHRYRFRTRIVKQHHEPELSTSIFGHHIRAPIMVPSMSGVKSSMKEAVPERDFFQGLVLGAKLFGTIGMTGNTPEERDDLGIDVIQEAEGHGIPIFKPQSQQRLLQLIAQAGKAGCIAVGVDLDGCGSANWAKAGRPVYRKSESELKELVDSTSMPFIFKGVMSLEDAGAVVDSGAKAIYVSNHGGRVLDSGLGVAEVLPQISREFHDRATVMADGCVRSGFDVLTVLALGADVALIGRPLARMSLAGGPEAVHMYLEYVLNDLRAAMIMTGCDTLQDVSENILVKD